MSAREVAQSVPHRFYHGPDSICAPHLPIGSTERAAYFKELRLTAVEDWKDAEQSVARARLIAKGDLYFIRAGDAVKIGRTTNIVQRLANMQANNHEEINCLLLLKGCGSHEEKWHKRFADKRLRGEWFRWCTEIEMAIALERNLNMERCRSEAEIERLNA